MDRSFRTPFAFALFFAASLGATVSPPLWPASAACAASDEPAASAPSSPLLSNAEAQDLDVALHTLSARTGTEFVVEGAPRRPRLDAASVPALGADADLRQVIARLAAAYDYDAVAIDPEIDPEDRAPSVTPSRRLPHVFLLKKRYSDPQDLPCITLEEYVAALRDIRDLLDAFGPQPRVSTNTALIRGISTSLTDEQRRSMAGPGLPVAALTDAQKQQIQRVVLDGYTGIQVRQYEEILPILEQAGHITLGSHTVLDKDAFGYWFQDRLNRRTFWPIGVPTTIPSEDASDTLARSAVDSGGGQPDLMATPIWPADQTIAAAAERLNRQLAAGTTTTLASNNTRIEVEPSLQAKPLRVIGANLVPPLTTLDAVARLYDLRVVRLQTGYRLERRHRGATDLASLPATLFHTLPEPLLRALHVPWRLETGSDVSPETSHRQFLDFASRLDKIARFAAADLQAEAGTRNAGENASAVDTGTGGVSLAALGSAARSAFALCVSRELLAMMNTQFGNSAPPVALHWEEGILHGGEYTEGDHQRYRLTVVYRWRNPDGSMQSNTAGVTGLDYPFPNLN